MIQFYQQFKLKIMKKLIFSALLGLAMSVSYGQESLANCKTMYNNSFVYSVSKAGKVSTKEVEYVIVCDGGIEFRATPTSVMTIYKINETKWETSGGKVCNVSPQKDGSVAYWVSENKAFVFKN